MRKTAFGGIWMGTKKLKFSNGQVLALSFDEVFLKFKSLCDRLSYRWVSTYSVDDLQQEAYIALWNAFEKYDFEKYGHVLFSTFAFSCINYAHLRYNAKHRSKFHKSTSQITQMVSLQQPIQNGKGDSFEIADVVGQDETFSEDVLNQILISGALDKLSKNAQQEILAFANGFKINEIAKNRNLDRRKISDRVKKISLRLGHLIPKDVLYKN